MCRLYYIITLHIYIMYERYGHNSTVIVGNIEAAVQVFAESFHQAHTQGAASVMQILWYADAIVSDYKQVMVGIRSVLQ